MVLYHCCSLMVSMFGSGADSTRIPQMEQSGTLIIGPGGKKSKVDVSLPKLTSSQESSLKKAQKYAMEQNIKMVLVHQTIAHRQQVGICILAYILLLFVHALVCYDVGFTENISICISVCNRMLAHMFHIRN